MDYVKALTAYGAAFPLDQYFVSSMTEYAN